MTSRPLTVLCVENSGLSSGDYRVSFPRGRDLRVVYALPEKPDGVAVDDYEFVAFREGARLRDALAVAQLAHLLARQRRRLDVVLFYSTIPILVGPPLARLFRIPSLMTVTGYGRVQTDSRLSYRVLRGAHRGLTRWAMRSATVVLFQNESDRQAAIDAGWVDDHRGRWVGSGTALADAPAAPPNFDATPIRVFTASRLVASKGIDDLLEVARRLSGEEIVFSLAGGPSPGNRALHRRVIRAADAGLIEYLGPLRWDEVVNQLHSSQVFLLPSHAEGMSRALLEATALGLCPVGYGIPANLEVFGSVTDVAASRRNPACLADVLRHLVRDRARMAALAASISAASRRRYSVRAFGDRLEAHIRAAARR